jgi:Kef-type K+ transport system membrane component KefB
MSETRGAGPTLLAYALLLAAGAGLFFLIRAHGETLRPPPGHAVVAPAAGKGGGGGHAVLRLLLALAAVVFTGRVLGRLLVALGQPPVLGEVVGGILLGPSLLGHEWSALVLPPEVAPHLGMIAQLGVVLYMFLVGLELNPGVIRGRAHATVAISHASIVVPFVLGAALALWLYPRLAPPGVPFTSFALFLGVALSITAFPVLARILSDQRLSRTELGVLALTCAAIGDVTAWCLLAFVAGVVQSQVGGALRVAALSADFVAFMLAVVRPVAGRLVRRAEGRPVTAGTVAWVFVAVLLAALATEAIGIHAIFGAFLLGAVLPHDSGLAHALTRKLEDVVTALLLPAFFAYTGMRTELGLVSGAENWLICAAVVAAATAGKFAGTVAPARLAGLGWRRSASLGVLMNTRGLMELIVLNVGLDLGVISPTLFAMMVMMALATTLATTPLLRLLNPGLSRWARAGAEAREAAPV